MADTTFINNLKTAVSTTVDKRIQAKLDPVKTDLTSKIQTNTTAIQSATTKVDKVIKDFNDFQDSMGTADPNEVVKTRPQTLQEFQKQQARDNIDVNSKSEISAIRTKALNAETKALDANTKATQLGNRVSALERKLEGGGTGGATVKEFRQLNDQWYRLWSDGWLEQGGLLTAYNDNSAHYWTVTLLKPYPTSKYGVLCTPTYFATTYGQGCHSVNEKKTNTTFEMMTVSGQGDGNNNRPGWYTFGPSK